MSLNVKLVTMATASSSTATANEEEGERTDRGAAQTDESNLAATPCLYLALHVQPT